MSFLSHRSRTNFFRILLSTWNNIAKNSLLSLATILVIVLIVFFYNLVLSVKFLSEFSISELNKKIDITLELTEEIDFSDQRVMQLEQELQNANIQVNRISKEQALNDLKQILPDIGAFLEQYRQNPLPNSLYLRANNLESYQAITNIMQKNEYQEIVQQESTETSFQKQQSRIEKIIKYASQAKTIVFLLQILFLAIAVLVIFNTIQIVVFHHRDEMNIMKLVGASREYIIFPFILEGIFYGIFGMLIGFTLFWLALFVLIQSNEILVATPFLQNFMHNMWKLYSENIMTTAALQALLFGAAGMISSTIATFRFGKFSFHGK